MCTYGYTKVRSFRIDTCLDNKFQRIAEKEGQSPSGFLSDIVELYVDFIRYAKQVNSIVISEASIKGFLNYLTEEECKENGLLLGSSVPTQLILLSGQTLGIESLEASMDHIGNNSGWFRPSLHGKGKTGYWYIQNVFGTKWRYFLEGYLTVLIRSLGAESMIEPMGDNLILRIVEAEK